jgi:hypothetical protein
MRLYEINKEYEDILNDIYNEEGEINQDALVRLENNELAVQEKIIATACFIKNLDAERESISVAKKAMAEREARYKKRTDDLQGYLLFNMEKRGITNVKCPYFEIKLKKCPPSVDILDESALPGEYMRTKTEILPDKVKMLSEMKMGVIIPGAGLKHNMKLDIQ